MKIICTYIRLNVHVNIGGQLTEAICNFWDEGNVLPYNMLKYVFWGPIPLLHPCALHENN